MDFGGLSDFRRHDAEQVVMGNMICIPNNTSSALQWNRSQIDVDVPGNEAEENDTAEYMNSNEFTILSNDASRQWRENDKNALAVFVLSGIGLNKTLAIGRFRREIRLNGWEGSKHRNVLIKCCLLWRNNKITQFINPQRAYWKLSQRLSAVQYTCPIRGQFKDLTGAAMEFKTQKCPENRELYVIPDVAQKQSKQSFAICVKIVFGNVDVKSLVHWIEYHRQMKVQKIFMYTYNVSSQARAVISKYMKEGFIDSRQFNYPWKSGSKFSIFQLTETFFSRLQTLFCCYTNLIYSTVAQLQTYSLTFKHLQSMTAQV